MGDSDSEEKPAIRACIYPPIPLVLGSKPAVNWKLFKQKYESYVVLTELDKQSVKYQTAMFTYCLSDEALMRYNSFHFESKTPTVAQIMDKFKEFISSEGSGKETSSEVSGKETSSEVSGKETSSKVSGEETSSEVSGEETSSEGSGEETSSEVSGEETSSEVSGEETSSELRFDGRKKGKKIDLKNDGTTATRSGDKYSYSNGVVVATKPMRCNKLYEVEINRVHDRWSRTSVGVATNQLNQVPKDMHNSGSDSVLCVSHDGIRPFVGKMIETQNKYKWLQRVPVGTKVGLALDSSRLLHVYVNGQDQGVITSPPIPDPCYFMFDLCGYCTKVTAQPVRAVNIVQDQSR